MLSGKQITNPASKDQSASLQLDTPGKYTAPLWISPIGGFAR